MIVNKGSLLKPLLLNFKLNLIKKKHHQRTKKVTFNYYFIDKKD
jgi:hypothetical protein